MTGGHVRAIALCAVCACAPPGGRIDIALVVAPGSRVLDDVHELRLTLSNPPQVATAIRTNDSFALAIDVEATGEVGTVAVDGLDAGGAVIASGASPPFPIYPADTRVAIYMAVPNSIGAAPVTLPAARDQLGVAALPYGAVIAGGREPSGVPSDAVAVYNAYDHSLATGVAMPGPRAGVAAAVGFGRYVYLFGGRDASGSATGTLWRLDTQVAPSGAIVEFGNAAFPRADQSIVPIGDDRFVITGSPPLELSAATNNVIERRDAAALPPTAAAVIASSGSSVAIFVGSQAVFRFRDNSFEVIEVPGAKRDGANVVGLPNGQVAIACGDGDAIRLDPVTGVSEAFSIPTARRTGCAMAATPRHLVIAGGTMIATGAIATTAEIYDATTLTLVTTVPLTVPRTGALATALPNDQVLISSGLDDRGAPTATLELFTPGPRD